MSTLPLRTYAHINPITGLRLVCFLGVSLWCHSLFAQREPLKENKTIDSPNALSLQYGPGFLTLIPDVDLSATIAIGTLEEDFDVSLSTSFASSLNYDYCLTKPLSIGATVGRQRSSFTNFRSSTTSEYLSGRLDITRTLVGIRLLAHYGSEKVDLYSGIRGGLTIWRFKATGELENRDINPSFFPNSVTTVSPQFSVVLFGALVHINEHIFVGGELVLGSPHILAITAGFRF